MGGKFLGWEKRLLHYESLLVFEISYALILQFNKLLSIMARLILTAKRKCLNTKMPCHLFDDPMTNVGDNNGAQREERDECMVETNSKESSEFFQLPQSVPDHLVCMLCFYFCFYPWD